MNPLSSYFRQPKVYVSLPSTGRFWPDGSLNLPVSGELPVMSMNAADELILKSPEALMNGEATVNLIQSCIPAVLNAWETPSMDLETLLVAIRIASLGDKMEVEVTCEKCAEANNFELNLEQQMNNIDASGWLAPLTVQDLIFRFKSPSYRIVNEFNNQIYRCQKQIQQLSQIPDPVQQEQITSGIVNELNAAKLQLYIASIHSIEISGQSVSNSEHISEFLVNCEKRMYQKVIQHLDQLKDRTQSPAIRVFCPDCNHEFAIPFNLDYAYFFELSS